MIARLKKQGDEYIIVLDSASFAVFNDLLQADDSTPLELSAVGDGIMIKRAAVPAPPGDGVIPDEEFRAALEKVNRNYGNALKKLAE